MMGEEIQRVNIDKLDFIWQTCSRHANYAESNFDKLFHTTWTDAERNKVLNYNVQNVCTKILPGHYKIICQLNPMRKEKRRSPDFISSIKQPFDPTKFNFALVKNDEILFEVIMNKSLMEQSEGKDETATEAELISTVIVNTAPITPFHGLLVPSLRNFKPQVLDSDGLLLGVCLVLASNTPALKVGFNSLGGMASVNHGHLHIYYLPYPIHVETATCQKLSGPVYTFQDHYAPGFIFQLEEDQDVGRLVRDCSTFINFLLKEEICHNVMITRGVRRGQQDGDHSIHYNTVRVCIWARKQSYGVKDIGSYVAALCELAGHLPVYDEKTWKTVTEDDVTKMADDVCLETYTDLLPKIQQLFS